MSRRIWLGWLAVSMFVASCNCGGGEGAPCKDSSECQGGRVCTAAFCTTPVPGPNGTDGGGGGGGSDGELPDGGPLPAGGVQTCVGLECQQATCPGGVTTTLTGKVFSPAGDLPLYNAIVYVPNSAVQAFTEGATCDKCGAVSGNPVVQTLSKADGSFRLENVPAGQNIPLVIQLGKWRRQVILPAVTACTEAAIDTGVTRLPRNASEGDIPKMAIVTGQADPFECLLRKVGIEDAEITAPSGTGRVHFFHENGKNLSPAAPQGSELYASVENLKKYDVVMLPCEGEGHYAKTTDQKRRLIDYTDQGGRVFATHFSYDWIKDAPAPFNTVASWTVSNNPDPVSPFSNPFGVNIDTTFPKGASFAEWLGNVSASTGASTMDLREVRHNVDSVNEAVATRWLYGTNTRFNPDRGIVTHFTFNTPVAALLPDGGSPDQCGRVVFSSFHVSASALNNSATSFPATCKNEPPTAQEKALIFMLFDLSSCVQRDEIPPIN